MAMSDRKSSDIVSVVRCILDQLHLDLDVTCPEDITPQVFLEIFEGLIGEPLLAAIKPAVFKEDKECNCRLILHKLADIVGVSLDHISPRALVIGDPIAVANLVEIFSGLMEQLMDAIVTETESDASNDVESHNTGIGTKASVQTNFITRAEELESRFPNIFSVVGRDKALQVFDSTASSAEEKEKLVDDELESLLNVDFNIKPWAERSPLRQRRPVANRSPAREAHSVSNKSPLRGRPFPSTRSPICHREAVSSQRLPSFADRPRKIIKLPGTKASQSFGNYSRRNIRFADLPRREESAANGAVLDSSNYKSTFCELKSELANEKTELARRLNAVKSRYRRAEIAAKTDAEEARDVLRSRTSALHEDTSFASSSLLDTSLEQKLLFPTNKPAATKKRLTTRSTFSHLGFLSKTHAEDKKRAAVKRLCEKYRATRGMPEKSSASPSAATRRDLIARLQVHFPGIELDDATSRRLWAEYSRHVQALGRVADSARTATRRRARDAALSLAERQQQILLKLVRREMAQAKRVREENERKQEVVTARNRTEDSKIQCIRSERYYSEFVDQARARMANKQFGEEMLFRNLFRDAIKAQRDRLLDLASTAREVAAKRDEAEGKRAAQLRSSFQDRLRMLNEKVISERQIVETREREQARYLSQMKRELRSRLESELRNMQSQAAADFAAERVAFRELDAEAVRMQIYAEAKQTQPFLK